MRASRDEMPVGGAECVGKKGASGQGEAPVAPLGEAVGGRREIIRGCFALENQKSVGGGALGGWVMPGGGGGGMNIRTGRYVVVRPGEFPPSGAKVEGEESMLSLLGVEGLRIDDVDSDPCLKGSEVWGAGRCGCG